MISECTQDSDVLFDFSFIARDFRVFHGTTVFNLSRNIEINYLPLKCEVFTVLLMIVLSKNIGIFFP